ncbi:nuclear transport factor 2 family protein [Dysgonomonas sp. HDW5A]|uniref:nuclear transport factor 2 family protein n=1 Tax=Dysgonomonas sp. HDW5A TaxID=2714926 RepID=UPI0014096382|nr:nuclear transport factor 2 family protein [Dysgonomonas sp. HDW5A]QIK59178.1 nuclear transport factor 2 family protein [Dysgonomonas sp. HDW5A]
MKYSIENQKIIAVIDNYFKGIFEGDVSKLKSIFHPNALLFGDIANEAYFKHVDEYLEIVNNRKSPKENNENFKMEIISIEILGNNAVAKLHVPMLGFNYYDLLSLSKVDGQWLIVNKLFTHIL